MRCVIDTNVIVSASMFAASIPRQTVEKVLSGDILLVSHSTIDELKDVLFRKKFDRYVSPKDRVAFLGQLSATAEFVEIVQLVRECRDPRDDKFLEVALNGAADMIISGDKDLLEMNPWRGVAIVSPANYMIC